MRCTLSLLSAGLVAGLLVACGGGEAPAAPEAPAASAKAASERVTVSKARVRAAPPGAPATAAFMTLTATGPGAALVSAASDAATTVELHTHTEVDGAMQMRPVERIEVPADGAVTLEPGGLHVMLIGPTRALAEGDTVALTLTFDDGSTQDLSAPVTRIGAGMGGGMHGKHGAGLADGHGPHGKAAHDCGCGGDPAACDCAKGGEEGKTCGCGGDPGSCSCGGPGAGGHGAH